MKFPNAEILSLLKWIMQSEFDENEFQFWIYPDLNSNSPDWIAFDRCNWNPNDFMVILICCHFEILEILIEFLNFRKFDWIRFFIYFWIFEFLNFWIFEFLNFWIFEFSNFWIFEFVIEFDFWFFFWILEFLILVKECLPEQPRSWVIDAGKRWLKRGETKKISHLVNVGRAMSVERVLERLFWKPKWALCSGRGPLGSPLNYSTVATACNNNNNSNNRRRIASNTLLFP